MDVPLKYFVACVILAFSTETVRGQSCTYLDAEDYTQTFDSHSGYPLYSYNPDESRCWVIQAQTGQSVELNSVTFDLESGCYDSLKVYDGLSSYAPLSLTVCDTNGIYNFRSTSEYVYLKFESDSDTQEAGFRIEYKAVEDNEEPDSGYYPYYYDDSALTTAAIVGIVLGSLFGLAVVVGVIVAIVFCCIGCNKQGKVHNRPAQQATVSTIHTSHQAYPRAQVYPATVPYTSGYAGGAVLMNTQTMAPQQQPVHQPPSHPVDANGVPQPAVYTEPHATK